MTSPRLLNVSPTLGRSIREFAGGQQPAENDRWQSVFRQIEEKYKDEPSFDLMSNWKARTALQRNGG